MKISIITINFNNKPGLLKTIGSVMCQALCDFEWIVIDGGSSDGSRELIEQHRDAMAYWCSEPDRGIPEYMLSRLPSAHTPSGSPPPPADDGWQGPSDTAPPLPPVCRCGYKESPDCCKTLPLSLRWQPLVQPRIAFSRS